MDEKRKRALKEYQQALRTGLLIGNILPALRPLLTDVEYSRVREREGNVASADELIEILLTKRTGTLKSFAPLWSGTDTNIGRRRCGKKSRK